MVFGLELFMDIKKIVSDNRIVHALPVGAYTEKGWFDLEMKTIFSRTWQFAGLVEDIEKQGDFISVQAGLNSIFVIKGRDQKLRAYHNMCRHRGTQLLRGVGKLKSAITCPYHDWTYNLEGKLQSIPKQSEEFPELVDPLHKCNLNLIEASVDFFKGMIFVHPDKNAPSIMSYFGEVQGKLGPHVPEELVEYKENKDGSFYTKVINANWKIVVENYIDHYHLAQLHSGTLNMYDHANARFGWCGPHYWFYEPLIPEYKENIAKLSQTPVLKCLNDKTIGAYVPWLFPNIGLTESEGSWNTFHLTPLAPDKTLVTIRTKVENLSEWEFSKQYTKSSSSAFWKKHGTLSKSDGDPEVDPLSTADFMAEDIYVCEQQQKSFSSPYFSIGAQAKRGEFAVRKFQETVQEWILKEFDK
jgi:Rieske 2Fe-2S family protein